MEWLNEAVLGIAIAFWLTLTWAYWKARQFRSSFERDQPGRRLLDIIVKLYGWVLVLATATIWRMAVAVIGEDPAETPLRVLNRLVVAAAYLGLAWWTIISVRRLAAHADGEDDDLYAEPFGDFLRHPD